MLKFEGILGKIVCTVFPLYFCILNIECLIYKYVGA